MSTRQPVPVSGSQGATHGAAQPRHQVVIQKPQHVQRVVVAPAEKKVKMVPGTSRQNTQCARPIQKPLQHKMHHKIVPQSSSDKSSDDEPYRGLQDYKDHVSSEQDSSESSSDYDSSSSDLQVVHVGKKGKHHEEDIPLEERVRTRETATLHRTEMGIGLRQIRFFIDSRDRILSLYPSANSFVWMLPNKIKRVIFVEIASAKIPIVAPPVAEPYVIITEDHCTDAMTTHSALISDIPNSATGCGYTRGIIGFVPFSKQFTPGATDNYVWWQNGALRDIRACTNLQGTESTFDRFHFRVWTWNISHSGVPYPLPAEVGVPSNDNNIVLEIVLTCEL